METVQMIFVICLGIALVSCHHGDMGQNDRRDHHYQRDYQPYNHRDHHDTHPEHHSDHRDHRPYRYRFFQDHHRDMRFHGPYPMHDAYGYGHGPFGDRPMGEHRHRPSDEPRREHHGERGRGCCKKSGGCRQKGQEEDTEHDSPDNKIWRFHIGDNFGGFEYLDNTGRVKGFHIDLLFEICDKAGKKCHFVVDAYDHCWTTHGDRELPGVGLMDEYYDGCIGLLPTPERLNSFNFTVPFAPNINCGLHYKSGTQQTTEEARNVTGRKIGFVGGWALSRKCFERQEGFVGNHAGEYEPTMFESVKGMMRALLQDEIDAVLITDSFNTDTTEFSLTEPTFRCTSGGSSVMTQYGSELLDWWNDAFQRMKNDDSFRRLCRRANQQHGHKGRINCLFA